MSEHVVNLYGLNNINASELRRLLPDRPDVTITDISPEDDPRAHREILADATVVLAPLIKERRIEADMLDLLPNCRLIQSAAVGFDGVDHLAAAERGIRVANLPGFNSDAVADWTVGALLCLLRNYTAAHTKITTGGWGPDGLRGHELSALTVGILGFGNIGRALARRLDGFGTTVLVHDPLRPEPGRTYLELEELLPRTNVLSVHLPLNAGTANLLDDEALAKLPEGTYLINAGRGGVIDEDALARALQRGHLAGAALDVFAEEPLPADSPLRERSDVLLTPHTAGVTWQAYHKLRTQLIEALANVLSGNAPENVVNGVRA